MRKLPLNRHRLLVVSLVLAGTVGCDQATKQVATSGLRGEPGQSFIGGLFQLGYLENPGAFLSLFGDLPRAAQFWLLTAGVGALLLGMLVYTLTVRHLPTPHAVAFALFTGGGLSNWIDRVTNDGRVVDFMSVGLGRLRTGVFNVADVAIMVGVGLLLLKMSSREDGSATGDGGGPTQAPPGTKCSQSRPPDR